MNVLHVAVSVVPTFCAGESEMFSEEQQTLVWSPVIKITIIFYSVLKVQLTDFFTQNLSVFVIPVLMYLSLNHLCVSPYSPCCLTRRCVLRVARQGRRTLWTRRRRSSASL